MKKLSLCLLGCLLAVVAGAQNIQLHYDFGSALYHSLDTRPKVTTTVEMFKPDRWGSTYFFIDMDYTKNVGEAPISLSTWTIRKTVWQVLIGRYSVS